VLSPVVRKVLLLQIILYKQILCQVSLTSAGASWEPGDPAFQNNLCVWGWVGEGALCVGGQGGELLAEGTKQGRSEVGNRKVVIPSQWEEFSWVKNPSEIHSVFYLKNTALIILDWQGSILPPLKALKSVGWFYKPGVSARQIIHIRVFLTGTRLPEHCRSGLYPPLFLC